MDEVDIVWEREQTHGCVLMPLMIDIPMLHESFFSGTCASCWLCRI